MEGGRFVCFPQTHARRREIVTAAVRELDIPCSWCPLLVVCGSDRSGTSCHSDQMFPCAENIVSLGFAGNSGES